jgi:hypothetical protein
MPSTTGSIVLNTNGTVTTFGRSRWIETLGAKREVVAALTKKILKGKN